MQVGTQSQIYSLAQLQRSRPATRPQPPPLNNEIPRLENSRKTNHNHAVMHGEYVQRGQATEAEQRMALEGLSTSAREALQTYAETARFQSGSLRGELVGIDLYV